MISPSDAPARRMSRAAVRRRSWKIRPTSPAGDRRPSLTCGNHRSAGRCGGRRRVRPAPPTASAAAPSGSGPNRTGRPRGRRHGGGGVERRGRRLAHLVPRDCFSRRLSSVFIEHLHDRPPALLVPPSFSAPTTPHSQPRLAQRSASSFPYFDTTGLRDMGWGLCCPRRERLSPQGAQ